MVGGGEGEEEFLVVQGFSLGLGEVGVQILMYSLVEGEDLEDVDAIDLVVVAQELIVVGRVLGIGQREGLEGKE